MTFGHAHQGREGDPSLGIGLDVVETIVELVVTGVRHARPVLLSLSGFDENGASVEVFKGIVQAQRQARIRSVEFHPEGILLGQGVLAPKRYRGRIDFQVKATEQFGDYDRYFGVECKLLRSGHPSKTLYYTRAGIGKFVDGTYSPRHPMAMLVGYVLAPTRRGPGHPLKHAMADVERSMARHHTSATSLVRWRGRYPDALVMFNEVPRTGAAPIRLLHAMVRMFN